MERQRIHVWHRPAVQMSPAGRTGAKRFVLWASVAMLALGGAGCPGGSPELVDLVRDARKALDAPRLRAQLAAPAIPDFLEVEQDLPGNAAPQILDALEEYRFGSRPTEPARDITAIFPLPGRDTSPFAPFVATPEVSKLIAATRKKKCRFTGVCLPVSPDLVDGEVISLEACRAWVWVMAEKSRILEKKKRLEEAETVLRRAHALGCLLEQDPMLANVAAGRAVRREAVFLLESFWRRQKDRRRESLARTYGDILLDRGRYWLLAKPLGQLALTGKGAFEAAERVCDFGNLALALDVAAAIAMGRMKNLDECDSGPDQRRFEALKMLREKFPDPLMGTVAEYAEALLVLGKEGTEEFIGKFMPDVRRYGS